MPQLPQFCESSVVSTHLPLQAVVPVAQPAEHWLAEQSCPAGQALPHAPQCSGSLVRSAHLPVPPNVEQFVVPPRHSSAHLPRVQSLPSGQALPQPPQCSGSLLISAHTPLQSTLPTPQAARQLP